MLSNKLYDILKYTATTFLPAFIALYGVISLTWGLPSTEQVMTTLAAANTFLGALLGISSAKYHKELGE